MTSLQHDHLAAGPVRLLTPRRFGDARGWFSETYSEKWAAAHGIDVRFVQDNHSYSAEAGTIRGLHLQRPPHGQAKLVRCVRGAIRDYALDVRTGSPTWGQWVSTELSAANGHQLFVPVGFAHAFCTLTPDVEVIYKVSDVYAPECDAGVAWDDPDIGIDWPLPPSGASLSDKDRMLPRLKDFESPFAYDGLPLLPLEVAP